MPRGWYGQPRRHADAARKGWRNRRNKLPTYNPEKLRKLHANRRRVSRLRDEHKTAKKVVQKEKIAEEEHKYEVHSWTKDPSHSDIENIDTKKKENVKKMSKEEVTAYYELKEDSPMRKKYPKLSGRTTISLEEYYKNLKEEGKIKHDYYDELLMSGMEKRRKYPNFKLTKEEIDNALIKTISEVPKFETKSRRFILKKKKI